MGLPDTQIVDAVLHRLKSFAKLGSKTNMLQLLFIRLRFYFSSSGQVCLFFLKRYHTKPGCYIYYSQNEVCLYM